MNLVTIGTKDGAFVPSISPEALGKREAILDTVALFGRVTDAESLAIATNHTRGIKELIKLAEESREAAKKPFWDAGKAIDAAAKEFVAELLAELSRIDLEIRDFRTKEAQRIAQEQARIREEQERIAREQARIEREAREKREADEREIARQKVAAELTERQALEAAQREQDAAKRAEMERQAEAARAAALAETERLQREAAEREAEEKRVAAAIASARESQIVHASAPTELKGQRVGKEIKFEVTDAAKLYRSHPDFFKLVEQRSAIKTAIGSGRITIPTCPAGLKMWEEVVVKDTTRRTPTGLTLEA